MNKIKFLIFSAITLCTLSTYTYDSIFVYDMFRKINSVIDHGAAGHLLMFTVEQELTAKYTLTQEEKDTLVKYIEEQREVLLKSSLSKLSKKFRSRKQRLLYLLGPAAGSMLTIGAMELLRIEENIVGPTAFILGSANVAYWYGALVASLILRDHNHKKINLLKIKKLIEQMPLAN